MNINISEFRAKFLNKGLSSPAKYYVEFDRSGMILQPEAINLPGKTFKTFEDEVYGAPRQVPLREQYEPVVMTFPVSTDWKERDIFEGWMAKILNPEEKTVDYSGGWGRGAHEQITIVAMKANEEISALFVLNEAYPISIIPINMGFGMFNDYTRLQISFAYRDYAYLNADGSKEDFWITDPNPGPGQRKVFERLRDTWYTLGERPPGGDPDDWDK